MASAEKTSCPLIAGYNPEHVMRIVARAARSPSHARLVGEAGIDDLIQGAMLKIVLAQAQYHSKYAFSTWATRIVRNAAVDMSRLARDHGEMIDLEDESPLELTPAERLKQHHEALSSFV